MYLLNYIRYCTALICHGVFSLLIKYRFSDISEEKNRFSLKFYSLCTSSTVEGSYCIDGGPYISNKVIFLWNVFSKWNISLIKCDIEYPYYCRQNFSQIFLQVTNLRQFKIFLKEEASNFLWKQQQVCKLCKYQCLTSPLEIKVRVRCYTSGKNKTKMFEMFKDKTLFAVEMWFDFWGFWGHLQIRFGISQNVKKDIKS